MAQWARGRARRRESTAVSFGGRRRERQWWRRCRASGGAWVRGEEEGVEAEPLSASARLGVAGGHGYGDDDGEVGETAVSSQGGSRVAQWARGRARRRESTAVSFGGRRREQRWWRRCRAFGGAWVGGEGEGVEAEPLSASARLGVAGGHEGARRRRRRDNL